MRIYDHTGTLRGLHLRQILAPKPRRRRVDGGSAWFVTIGEVVVLAAAILALLLFVELAR